MVPLGDPLWETLPDARRSPGTATRLLALGTRWTKDAAEDFEWDVIGTSDPSPAAIASVPHLLSMTSGLHGKRAAKGAGTLLALIFIRLSTTSVIARDAERNPEPIRGAKAIPPKRWQDALASDVARRLETDLTQVVPGVRDAFQMALTSSTGEVATTLLAGLAASWSEHDLARALDMTEDGVLRCTACGDCCLWLVFPGTVAVYPDWDEGPRSPENLDLKDHAPNRAAGRIIPNLGAALSVGARAVWTAADREDTRNAWDLVRHMLGKFTCPRCGAGQTPNLI